MVSKISLFSFLPHRFKGKTEQDEDIRQALDSQPDGAMFGIGVTGFFMG